MPPVLFFLMATIFWGLNFHLAKVMLAQVSFVEAGFWRYLMGVGFLVLIQLKSRERWSLAVIIRAPKGILLVGLIGLFAFNLLFFLGLKYTSALNAALLVSLNPALTVLFAAALLGDTINRGQQLGMLVAILGVVYLLSRGDPSRLLELEWALGDLLILGANLVFALQNVWVKQYGAQYGNAIFTLATNALCLLGFVALLPVVGMKALTIGDHRFWLAVLGIGILGTALAYFFWNEGIKRMGPNLAGLFMNVVPLAAAFFALFFGERLEIYHFISGVVIITGVVFFQRAGRKKLVTD